MLRRRLGNFLNQGLRRFEAPEIDDKGLEIVVIVLGLSVVMGEPICNVIFGCDSVRWAGGQAARGMLRLTRNRLSATA